MRPDAVAAWLLTAVALSACSEGPAGPAAPTLGIALSPATLTLHRGESATTTLELDPIGSDAAVTITPTAPTGLTATIPAASVAGSMHITIGVQPTAALGEHTVILRASASGFATETTELAVNVVVPEYPPFGGTIFIDPDIITDADPTTFEGLVYEGQGPRTMYDRRVDGSVTVNAFIFVASFDDGLTAQIQVNPEFGTVAAAQAHAESYAGAIGRLPTALRTGVETVWIHDGVELFGGGLNGLLIHVGMGDDYIGDGILEEVLVHEAAHTSLSMHDASDGWHAAQIADGSFISAYARDNPGREDVAESYLAYLAIRYRAARISDALRNTILATIPNRIAFFDQLGLDMHPIE